jgi:hypothetical protein
MRCTVLLVYGEGKGGGCLKRRRLMVGLVRFLFLFFLASA